MFLLHRELVARGIPSRVLAPASSPLLEMCLEHDLPAQALAGRRPWSALAGPLQALSPAVLHAHDSHAIGLAAVARWRQPKHRIVGHRRVSYRPVRLAWRPKYRAVSIWIAVSADISSQLEQAGAVAGAVRVIPSAIDLDRLCGDQSRTAVDVPDSPLDLPENAKVIAVVGAVTAQKGQEILIVAAPMIAAAVPEAVVVVVGEGPDRARLEALACTLGVGHMFRWLGFRNDVPSILRRSSILVAPSLAGEGSPAVVKEAMAVGTPAVVSELPGNREVIGQAGRLVPVGDAPALAEVVVQLLRDDQSRRRMSEAGRLRAQLFHPRTMADATLAVYQELE